MKGEDQKLLEILCSAPEPRLDLLEQVLKDRGLTPKRLPTPPYTHLFIPGSQSLEPILLVAHFDRVPDTPGANDNTASLVHLIRFLSSQEYSVLAHRPHVLFTDGEELTTCNKSQGVLSLLKTNFRQLIAKAKTFVFDMTGKGDTFVLGSGSENLLKEQGLWEGSFKRQMEDNRRWARQVLSKAAPTGYVELPTPFSDDLAFLEQGLPAIQISMLPFKEAKLAQKNGLKPRPKAWSSMHQANDFPQDLYPEAFDLMAKLLEEICRFPYR
jgi:hypothetical protein